MKNIVTHLIVYLISCSLSAQVKGKISDLEGNPLAFVSVYIKNSTKGTISNKDGSYILEIANGKHRLVFQYLAFQLEEREIEYTEGLLELDIRLKPSIYNLEEIVISSNQEDPAYPIIRKAISKRKYYFKSKADFHCNAYTKGSIKILDLPTKILGKEIGNLDGNLDSNRKGIIYLSETVSKLSFRKPDKYYEQMISSRISGRDNGFSFNRASSALFNLYDNTNEFGRAIVSPTADFAFDYYKYKLLSTDTVGADRGLVHRIQIIPKNKSLPAWSGMISIQDSSWSLYDVNLSISGKQVQQELFDSIYLSQIFIPVSSTNPFELQSQVFGFKASLFVIKLEGKFAVVFSDYNFETQPLLEDHRVLLRIEEGANTKLTNYWDSIRPVPLTMEENLDYQIKDSIKLIRDSRSYKDSVDRIRNQFKPIQLLTGYTFHNTFKKRNFAVGSPLEIIHFNPIQGLSFGAKLSFSQKRNNNDFNGYKVESHFDYGLAEHKFRPTINFTQRFNELRKAEFGIKLGIELEAFDHLPGSTIFHEVANLWLKKNYNKFYENRLVSFNYQQYLNYDFHWAGKISFNQRSLLQNNSNYSVLKKEKLYESNHLSAEFNDPLLIQNKDLFQFSNRLRWRPGTKVWLTPNETNLLESKWPEFQLLYRLSYYLDSKSYFQNLGLTTSNDWVLQNWGQLNVLIKANKLFHKNPLDPSEWLFANGNPFLFYKKENASDVFLALKPYSHSTDKHALSWFVEWDLQGKILDRIPVVNKLGLKELIRYSTLVNDRNRPYSEYSVGLGNIGYKVFRIFRLDWVHAFEGTDYRKSTIRLALLSNIGAGK